MTGDGADSGGDERSLKQKAFGGVAESFGKEIVPLGEEAGKLTVRAARLLFAPIQGMVWSFEKVWDWVESDVIPKLKEIPEERRQPPDPRIAVPALDAMRLITDKDELSEMFGQLLATAMDKEKANAAHPSFTEILRQITADEARLLAYIAKRQRVAAVVIRSSEKGKGHNDWQSHNPLWCGSEIYDEIHIKDNFHSYIDNLCRLEILRVPTEYAIGVDAPYEALDQSIAVTSLKAALAPMGREVWTQRRVVEFTDFGRAFLKACLPRAPTTAAGSPMQK